MKTIMIYLVYMILFLSCSQTPPEVRRILKAARGNRSELKKIIEHYRKDDQDKLKLKAAYYLLMNMDGKYYYQGEFLNPYRAYLKMFTNDPKRNSVIMDSLKSIYGPFSLDWLQVDTDYETLNSEYIIKNIDFAFKTWEEQPWGKDITFEHFCEYILPYRVGTEVPKFDRENIYNQYNKILDSVRLERGTSIDACSAINYVFISDGWQQTSEFSSFPDFTVYDLLEYRKGSCHEMAVMTIFVMRALCIPVAADFTPQWGNRKMGHEWNVVLDKNGKNEVFMGVNSNPGVQHLFDYKRAPVVYRNTFAKQTQSLAMIRKRNQEIPAFFTNPYIKNVSEEYFKPCNITITLDRKEAKRKDYVYACVFNDLNWVPVVWGTIDRNNANFEKLAGNIVYLTAYYSNRLLIPANYPFKLSPDGEINFLKPNYNKSHEMVLSRKYPFPWFVGIMQGGKFQGSDNPDFSNPIDLYEIPSIDSTLTWQEVDLKITKAYRYYRYLGPDGSRGTISEFEFYSNSKRIKGTLITGSELEFKPKETVEDGDILTYFESNKVNGGWIGTDFGRKIKINRIRYMPRTDDNSIVNGEVYELVYWDNDQWISCGIKTAQKDNYLLYTDVPSGALYLLHNLTKGKEERIFTYENGKQVWW